MLSTLWAAAPGRRCIVAMRGKKTLHFWFDNNDDATDKAIALDEEGFNVYFSPALFDTERVDQKQKEINPRTSRHYTGREQSTVNYLPALWVDLDAGDGKDYASMEDAFHALQSWVNDHRIPAPTHIVCSGYGLHVYWHLSRLVTHREWLPVAKHLKQACRVGGLAIDPARTADSASLLRPPGTHNRKRGAAAPVRVLGDSGTTVDLHAFRAALPMVGPVGTVEAAPLSNEWDTTVKHPPGDANRIADKCQQMGQVRFHKGKVEEPLWRAGLSIVWRCQDAGTLIHEWSQGDDRYDPDETVAKAEGTAGPATCKHFAEVNAEGCAGCPFSGKVTSPISLAYAEEKPEAVEEGDFIRVPGYTVNSSGVFMQPLGNDGGPLTKIAEFPVWIEEAREVVSPDDPQLKASLLLGWEDVRGHARKVPIPQAKVHDDRQWTAWLADNNLISFVKAAQMRNYISQMHKVRFKEKGARTVYSSLGWYNNRELFVIGKMGVTETGTKDVAVDIKAPIADLEPKGSLDAWKAAINCFNSERYYPQAFGVLMGFAAPLLELVDKNGGVVVFTGRSGFGKSLSAKAGLSIYSHPEKIYESAESSPGGLGLYMSEHRHVPVLIDEVTKMSANRLRDLIYMAANGAVRTTLTQKRERRTMTTWRTITMLTSNHSLVDMKLSDLEEAHRRRLVEVPVLRCFPTKEAETVFGAITSNYGVAAVPYLQFVMKHKDKIPALFTAVEAQIRKWGYTAPADRFAVWTCAAALLGGILAYLAGVFPFNPIPVVKAITRQGARDADEIMVPEEHAKDVLFEMLASESRRVCIWHPGKLATEDVDNPIARIRGDELWVRSKDLRDAWGKEHIFGPSIQDWLEEVASGGVFKRQLAPKTPNVSCYRFDMSKLGWDTNLLKGVDGG